MRINIRLTLKITPIYILDRRNLERVGISFIMIQKCFVKKNNQNLLAKPDYITLIDTELDDNFEDNRKG